MNTEKINKLAKIGTAVNGLILIFPGNKFAIPAGLYFYICMMDGLNEFIYGLVYYASITYLFISGFNKFNHKDDDISIIAIILISYTFLLVNVSMYLELNDTSCFITLLLYSIFSAMALISTIILYKLKLKTLKT